MEGEEPKIYKTASDARISDIVREVAESAKEANAGYFSMRQVQGKLREMGIGCPDDRITKLIGLMYHKDELAPNENREILRTRIPYNANDPVVVPKNDVMKGKPNLETRTGSLVDAGYRRGGAKVGGISRKAPGGG